VIRPDPRIRIVPPLFEREPPFHNACKNEDRSRGVREEGKGREGTGKGSPVTRWNLATVSALWYW